MKHALIALVLAAPVLADASKNATAPPPSGATVTAAPADSPLVAAAKRANRKGRKPANVITNDTLRREGEASVHITTTSKQAPLPKLPPPATSAETLAQQHQEKARREAAAKAAEQKQAAEKREEAVARATEFAEEDLFGDTDAEIDPAQAEKAQQDANQQKPPR